MSVSIITSNTQFQIEKILTTQLFESNLKITISDAKKAKKGRILFSPNTKNSKASVKLTRSWHIMDIEHAMKLISKYDDGGEKCYIKTTTTTHHTKELNELYLTMTGKPGKFHSQEHTKQLLQYKNCDTVNIIMVGNKIHGVVCSDASNKPRMALAISTSCRHHLHTMGVEMNDTYYFEDI